MTAAQIFTYTRFLTNTNSTTVSDANLLRALSEWNKKMVLKLSEIKENYGETTDSLLLASGVEGVSLPTDLMKLKRSEIHWTSTGSWYKLKFYELNENSDPNDTTTLNANFDQANPYATLLGEKLNLRPIPNDSVSDGVKVWYTPRPADLTSTTQSPTPPSEYHRFFVDLLSLDIKQMKREISSAQSEQEAQFIWKMLKNEAMPRINDQPKYLKARRENWN